MRGWAVLSLGAPLMVLLPCSIAVATPLEERTETEAAIYQAYVRHFGSSQSVQVKVNEWGRVALPLVRELSQPERAAEMRREHLLTSKQQERATDAIGPIRHGAPVYTHFLGSDEPGSDRWGTRDTILKLLALFDGWAEHCRTALPSIISEARPETCTVQVGDLGWYNDTTPDPLGHTDHHRGTCTDLRLFRNDGSRYEAWWNQPDERPEAKGGYSRALTGAFLTFAAQHHKPSVLYFNDPALVATVPGLVASPGHDDHIHLCF